MAAVARAPRREIQVVGLITFAHFLSHLYMLALAPLYPLIQPDIGVTWSGIGAAIAAFAIATGVLQTPIGFLIDRIGGRKVLIAGLFVMAASTGLIGFVESLWQLIALMALAGVGNSVFHPADYSLISNAVADKRLGRAFSIHNLGGHFGFVSAPIVMVALQSVIGWRTAVITVGAVGVALALIILLLSVWPKTIPLFSTCCAIPSFPFVTPGLDPGVQKTNGITLLLWIAGSSPAMTPYTATT